MPEEPLSSKRYEPPPIDLENKNSSHVLLIDFAGFNKNILEIGTSTGYITKILQEHGNTVTGIEIDEEAGFIAEQYCERMIIGDVEVLDLDSCLSPGMFDVILLGDVLEHMKTPAQFLKKIQKFLREEGYVVVSLPNFCHGDVFLTLFCGDFRYTPFGLLDSTHLRFFGLKNIVALFTECGYQISEMRTTNQNIGETELSMDHEKFPADLLNFVRSLPHSDVYQFVFTAYPSTHVNPPDLVDTDLFDFFSDSKEKDARLREMNEKYQLLHDSITAKENQLQELLIKLELMDTSILWRMTTRFHQGFVERLLPEFTKRRKWYDRGLKGGRLLVNEGWGSLWWNFWEYQRDKKKVGQTRRENLHTSHRWVEGIPNPEDVPGVNTIEKLTFFRYDTPLVSIIIPVCNKWPYSYRCLQSILSNTSNIAYEVIVADDCSTDQTQDMLEKIEGITVIKNDENLGYLKNCNNAVTSARGIYVLFLNNDTYVLKHWLSALLEYAEKDSTIAIMGPNIIARDGRLLENGWIIGIDGWGQPIGRGEDPTDYEYNYVKEVDCVTGACLLVRKDVFLNLGRFDEMYCPAYYEEFDLAFKAKKMGYKVVVQPQARVLHSDCSSYGNETRNRLSAINHQKFMERWSTILKDRFKGTDCYFLARDTSIGKKVILIIDDMVPHYDKYAGSLMMYQYTNLFHDMGLKVIFLPDNLEKSEPYTSEMQQKGIEIIYGSFDFNAWIWDNGKYVDFVLLSRPNISIQYIDAIKEHTNAKILYCMHDLHHLREQRRYEIQKNIHILKESYRLKKIEFDIFNKADILLTFSNVEADILLKELPEKKQVEVIPLFIYDEFLSYSSLPSYDNRKNIVFLGGFGHPPNVDAVLWFVKECFPAIVTEIPDIKFIIAGSNTPQIIQNLASDNIEVIGQIKDLRPFFENARVFVAPLRFGAGVKGKLVTSMYHGVPVITTPIGAEGLGIADGEHVLIAGDEKAFTKKVIELYTNKSLWEKLSVNSYRYIEATFSKQKGRERILDILGLHTC